MGHVVLSAARHGRRRPGRGDQGPGDRAQGYGAGCHGRVAPALQPRVAAARLPLPHVSVHARVVEGRAASRDGGPRRPSRGRQRTRRWAVARAGLASHGRHAWPPITTVCPVQWRRRRASSWVRLVRLPPTPCVRCCASRGQLARSVRARRALGCRRRDQAAALWSIRSPATTRIGSSWRSPGRRRGLAGRGLGCCRSARSTSCCSRRRSRSSARVVPPAPGHGDPGRADGPAGLRPDARAVPARSGGGGSRRRS